jgi:hypothetical protein
MVSLVAMSGEVASLDKVMTIKLEDSEGLLVLPLGPFIEDSANSGIHP